VLLGLWLGCTTAYLTGLRGVWSIDLVMFGGYLLLGWTLWRVGAPPLALLAIAAVAAVAAGDVAVIRDSLAAGRYDVGSWFSYKTINTVVVAVFVFVLALRLAPALSGRARAAFAFVGRHSLGIYLIHPLFLWPVRAWDLYGGHPLVVIPLYTAAAGALALAASVCLSRSRATAWLVP
jgi:surface polysaccharide O-acyltransferase-like enzyme